MKNNLRIIFILLLFIVALALVYFSQRPNLFQTLSDVTKSQEVNKIPREQQLIIATVGSKGDLEGGYREFADYLVSRLKEKGITTGVITTSSSAAEMANNMRLNKVDMYVDTVFSSYIVSKLSNSPIVAARWEYGQEMYNSAIFTTKESGIKSLADLAGKKIAFFEPYSTSAYFLPKSELMRKKVELEELKNKSDVVSEGKLGYYFEYNDRRIYTSVIEGKTDVGAVSEGVLRNFAGNKFDDLQIIHISPDVYRSVVTLNSNLSPELRKAIEDILFDMHTSTEGKKVLNDFHRTSKFTKVTENDPLLMPIKSLTDYVEKEIIQR